MTHTAAPDPPEAPPPALTAESMAHAAEYLAQRQPVFGGILARLGLPPFWQRPPGFETLVHVILEQQVSLASARATLERLRLALGVEPPGEVSAAAFLRLDDASRRAIGFSRQKSAYCVGLAQAVLSGELDLQALNTLPDEAVRTRLVQLKGIGVWTADVYLLIALRRPDILPVQDLGLIVGVKRAFGLPAAPDRATLLALGEEWRPYRSVATRLIWHHYLNP